MLEIDGVCRSIETGGNFHLVDDLSDKYFEAIGYATAPSGDTVDTDAIERRLKKLDQHQDYIMRLLSGNEDIYPGVTAAYKSCIEQVRILTGLQG